MALLPTSPGAARLRGHRETEIDEAGGLAEYTERVVQASGDSEDVVLVAQSLGGFTATLAAAKIPVREVVLVNAMIPLPGETPGAWWDNTGSPEARVTAAAAGGYGTELDLAVYFLHDVPPEIAAAGESHERDEAGSVFESICDFAAWPSVPIRVVAGADDRFFPVQFQRKIAGAARPRSRRAARRTPDRIGPACPAGELLAQRLNLRGHPRN